MLLGEITSGIVVVLMAALASLLTRHYALRNHLYTFWWAVSFWLAFVAAATDFLSYLSGGWNLWQYRLYLFTAATLVAYMGAGTVYLFVRRAGHVYIGVMTAIALAMAVTLAVTPVPHLGALPPGEKAQGFVPAAIALYFALLSGIGAVALFAGALWSFFRTRRSYNLWIALGALVFSAGGTVGTMVGVYQLFYIFQAAGSLILYYGIVKSFRPVEAVREVSA